MEGFIVVMLVIGIISIGWIVEWKKEKEELQFEEYNKHLKEQCEANMKRSLYDTYIKFGRTWFSRNAWADCGDFVHCEPVYSKDNILLGYNISLTEEGIKMLQEYRKG